MTLTANAESDQPIVAKAGRYYRNTRYLISAGLFIFGILCVYDGHVRWPRINQEILDLRKQEEAAKKKDDSAEVARIGTELASRRWHNDKELLLQRMLSYTLPPAGILLLIWTLRNSRGRYRFADDTLEVPGHPPVKLSEMTKLDRDLWDRKGIAFIDYETAAGAKGTLRLDDFVYERPPTDEIYEHVRKHFHPDEKTDDDEDEDDDSEEKPADT